MSVFNPFAPATAAEASYPTNLASLDIGPGTSVTTGVGGIQTLLHGATPANASLSIVRVKAAPKYIEVGLKTAGSGAQRAFAIGTVFGSPASQKRDQMPGWQPATLGLHSDDAKIFDGAGQVELAVTVPGLAPFHAVGAVAGVGILAASDGSFELIFTVNGSQVYVRKLAASAELIEQMNLAVGLLGPGVAVEVNVGEHAFRYERANALLRPALVAPKEVPVPVAPPKATFDPFAPLLPEARPVPSADLMRRIQQLPSNGELRRRCTNNKIDVMSVAWEDTGRTKGSCFGPNISDMTLAAGGSNMPIFRKPNFADLTSDQDMSSFWVVVGNEKAGEGKRSIQLSEYLTDIGKYTGAGAGQASLLAPTRDSKVLTAAQACVLPLRDGKVEFNVRLYNYQSQREPAVLVIVASSEGTSAQVVLGRDNLLRFNKAGGAADFIAERLTDDRIKRGVPVDGPMTADERKRNCLLIFQVPLKVSKPARSEFGLFGGVSFADDLFGSVLSASCSSGAGAGAPTGMPAPSMATGMACCAPAAPTSFSLLSFSAPSAPARGIEAAMISTSDAKGVYEGTRGHKLVRDTDFPIRCTLQYYHVTDTVDLADGVVAGIASQVNELYDAAAPWNKGSLVTAGASGRVTEHTSVLGFADTLPVAKPTWLWGFRL